MASNGRVGSTPISGTKPQRYWLRLYYFMYFLYILYSKNHDRYYIGHCQDIMARLARHNNRKVSSTKFYVPWEVVYTENFVSRALASTREREIKKQEEQKVY